jgi:hypothetical protein
MKNKIEQIILKAIGGDSNQIMDTITNSEGAYLPTEIEIATEVGYNRTLADLRDKAPEIAQEILDSVVEIIDKEYESLDYGMEEAGGTLQELKEILTK